MDLSTWVKQEPASGEWAVAKASKVRRRRQLEETARCIWSTTSAASQAQCCHPSRKPARKLAWTARAAKQQQVCSRVETWEWEQPTTTPALSEDKLCPSSRRVRPATKQAATKQAAAAEDQPTKWLMTSAVPWDSHRRRPREVSGITSSTTSAIPTRE